jgi:hypothetical protein
MQHRFGEVPTLFNVLWHLPSALHGLEKIAAKMIKSRAKMQTDFADLASYLVRFAVFSFVCLA